MRKNRFVFICFNTLSRPLSCVPLDAIYNLDRYAVNDRNVKEFSLGRFILYIRIIIKGNSKGSVSNVHCTTRLAIFAASTLSKLTPVV